MTKRNVQNLFPTCLSKPSIARSHYSPPPLEQACLRVSDLPLITVAFASRAVWHQSLYLRMVCSISEEYDGLLMPDIGA